MQEYQISMIFDSLENIIWNLQLFFMALYEIPIFSRSGDGQVYRYEPVFW